MRRVLLLNASGEALGLIPWTRALNLVIRRKVQVYEYFSGEGSEVRSEKLTFRIPSVVGLLRYVLIPNGRKVGLSKKNLLIRDGHRCQYCGRELTERNATCDHVVPQTKGGRHEWTNVVASCRPCNLKKGQRTLEQVNFMLRRRPFEPTRTIILAECAEQMGYECWRPYLVRA